MALGAGAYWSRTDTQREETVKILRYIVGAVIGAVLATGLWACSAPAQAEQQRQTIDNYEYQIRTLPDGRKMECLVHESGYGYAVTCDWSGAKP